MVNKIIDLLVSLDISRREELEPYHHRVRDREDVAALRCPRSGVIVLTRTDHLSPTHYADEAYEDAVTAEGVTFEPAILDDARRRRDLHANLVRGRRWLDFGTGPAAIMDVLGAEAAMSVGVEPNRRFREAAVQRGHRVLADLDELDEHERLEVVTLFHVLEHLPEPIETLRHISRFMEDGASLIVEVPHARDFLLEMLDCEAFRRFTLWSEHLILHTRRSLEAFLRYAGFDDIVIRGSQRYPLSNHLYWLRHGKPGGQSAWGFLDDEVLTRSYEGALSALDQTDTLIAYARRRATR